jgi:DNA-binding response OmpR family regulator
MWDVGATRSPASDIILVGMPECERTADVGRALAAEHLMPVMAFDREALMRFAVDRDFAAVVVDPALDPSIESATLLDTLRAATPAPVVVLGFVPGDGTRAQAAGISGLLGADASAADVVGTVVTAIAHRGQGDEVVACDHLVVDLRNFEAWHGTHRLDLTPTELRVLGALVSAHGDLVTKHELQRAAWGSAGAHDDNRLQAHIRRLRTKLANASGDGAGECQVRTVRGLGFRLDHAGQAPRAMHAARAHVHETTRADRRTDRLATARHEGDTVRSDELHTTSPADTPYAHTRDRAVGQAVAMESEAGPRQEVPTREA